MAAITCAFCHAPLEAKLGTVVCGYCGKPNNPSGLPGRTELRGVVREVVHEDLNRNGVPDVLEQRTVAPTQTAAQAMAQARAIAASRMVPQVRAQVNAKVGRAVALGALCMVGTGGFVAWQAVRQQAATRAVVNSQLEQLQHLPSGAAPAAPAKAASGPVDVMVVLGEDLLIADANRVARLDRATLATRWSVPRQQRRDQRGDAEQPALLTVVGDGLMVADRAAAEFYAVGDGAVRGLFQFADQSFPPNGACVIGDEVILDISFQKPLRLNALTAKRGTSAGACRPPRGRSPSCPDGQRCETVRADLDDRRCHAQVIANKVTYQACTSDDGGPATEVVTASLGKRGLWTVRGGAPNNNLSFLGVFGETLVIVGRDAATGRDVATGVERWRAEGASYRSPVVADAAALYFATDKTLVKLDLATGRRLATVDEPGTAEAPPPTP